MLTLRQRIFVIVALVIGSIVAIILYFIYGRTGVKEGADTTTLVSDTQQPVNNGTKGTNTTAPTSSPVVLVPYSEDLYVRQLTKVFVERLASYSNQNNNQNVTDVLSLATPKMQTWIRSQVLPDSRDYQGAVTEVLASKLKEKTATNATVTFETQQTIESKKGTDVGATKKQIVQKKGTVQFVKIGNDWKVDGLYWE